MNLSAFARDIDACASAPWLEFNRLKALGAFCIERWNDYSPWKYEPDLRLGISHDGRRFQLPMRMSSEDYAAFREIFMYGYYDSDLGQPRRVLDLGGYCGYTAIAFSARFPDAKIAAVEPHPGNFEALLRNVKLNDLSVTAFQAAATVEDGPVNLYLGGGMTHGLAPTFHSTDAIHVDGLSVPTILQRLGWDHPDLLKIDIEGAEEPLFTAQQSWLRGVRTIIGEYHGDYKIPELRRDLEPLGFSVSQLPHPFIFLAIRNH